MSLVPGEKHKDHRHVDGEEPAQRQLAGIGPVEAKWQRHEQDDDKNYGDAHQRYLHRLLTQSTDRRIWYQESTLK